MKKIKLSVFVWLLMATSSLYAQTSRETRVLRDFSAIKVSNSIEAELIQGDENRMEITASGIDLDNIETGVNNKTLEVKLARGNFRNHSVKVIITYKDIQGIEATTSAKVIAKTHIEAAEAYVIATTNAYIEANISADVLNLEAATNAKMYLAGEADAVNIKAFTKAEIDAKELTAETVKIQANTAATTYIEISDSIEGTLATAAKVLYGGNPSSINVKTTTGASINKQ